jgi:hypothetical protein
LQNNAHPRAKVLRRTDLVFKPRILTADQLLKGYYRMFKEVYSIPSIFKRLRGTTAWKNLFYPMNPGFRQSVYQLAQTVPA